MKLLLTFIFTLNGKIGEKSLAKELARINSSLVARFFVYLFPNSLSDLEFYAVYNDSDKIMRYLLSSGKIDALYLDKRLYSNVCGIKVTKVLVEYNVLSKTTLDRVFRSAINRGDKETMTFLLDNGAIIFDNTFVNSDDMLYVAAGHLVKKDIHNSNKILQLLTELKELKNESKSIQSIR